MQPNEYQQLALRTEFTPIFIQDPNIDQPINGNNPGLALTARQYARLMHAALGACTEVGELQDAIKKNLIYGKAFDGVNVVEECGDVLWYIALALHAAGYSMEECMQRNIDKLRARFPDKFTQDQAITRNLDVERAALEGNPRP